MSKKLENLTTVEPLLLSVERAGEALGVGRSTMFKLVRSGAIKHVKIFDRTLISVSELKAFIEREIASAT